MSNLKSQVKDLVKGGLTIPNLLSLLRIILIPIFIILFYRGKVTEALIIIFISGLTDAFDGKIARRFNQVSNLGKILDPTADKLTQITIAVMLFIQFQSSDTHAIRTFSYVFLLFLAKEALMLIGGLAMLSKNIRPGAAEIYGKVATFTFYMVMILIISFGPGFGAFTKLYQMPEILVMILVIISAVFTIIALISYVPGTMSQFKENKNTKKNIK